jgi:hypothetical protein
MDYIESLFDIYFEFYSPIFDYMLSFFDKYSFYFDIFLSLVNEYIIYIYNFLLNNPLFFWFGSFFLLTIIFSFLFISYLGLYGVFFLNLISLFFFWLSLLFYIKPIFIDQIVYNIYLCKW